VKPLTFINEYMIISMGVDNNGIHDIITEEILISTITQEESSLRLKITTTMNKKFNSC